MFSSLFKVVSLVIFLSSASFATLGGPDAWDVTGVASNDTLNMRAKATYKSKKVGEIPHNATCIKDFICSMPDRKWCQVEYQGTIGWVSGKFLAESRDCSSPSDFNKKVKSKKSKQSVKKVVIRESLVKKEKYTKSECNKVGGFWGIVMVNGRPTQGCDKKPKLSKSNQEVIWKKEVKKYKTHEELCNGIGGGVHWNHGSCTNWSVTTYIQKEQKRKYKFMLPYVLESEKIAKVKAKKDYSERQNENRIYAGIAMDTSLIGNGKTIREIGTYRDGVKGCDIKFAGLSGVAREKNGLVNEITISSYNIPYEKVHKIVSSMNQKYEKVDYKKQEEYRNLQQVQDALYIYHKALGSQRSYEVAMRDATPETIIKETTIFSHKGDRITLNLVTTKQGQKTKYDLGIVYLSKRSALENDAVLQKEQRIKLEKQAKENKEMSGF